MSVTAHYALAVLAVVLTAGAQVLLKLGAAREGRGVMRSFLDLRTVAAYALLFGVTLLNVKAYQVIPLKSAAYLLPATFALLVALAALVLAERPSRSQLLGMLVIAIGIAIFNL